MSDKEIYEELLRLYGKEKPKQWSRKSYPCKICGNKSERRDMVKVAKAEYAHAICLNERSITSN